MIGETGESEAEVELTIGELVEDAKNGWAVVPNVVDDGVPAAVGAGVIP